MAEMSGLFYNNGKMHRLSLKTLWFGGGCICYFLNKHSYKSASVSSERGSILDATQEYDSGKYKSRFTVISMRHWVYSYNYLLIIVLFPYEQR